MSTHSYGHGQHCFYCGANSDVEEEDTKACDFKLRKPPSVEEMVAYNAQVKLGEDIARVGESLEFGEEVDEAEKKIVALFAAYRGKAS